MQLSTQKNIINLSNAKALRPALELQKVEKEAHGEIETHHSGFLVAQDTYYVGYIKGVGKIYQQTGIDTYSNVGFAKLYHDKTQTVAADFLNSKVLPFFDEHGISVLRMLTDNGKEYCGNPETSSFFILAKLSTVDLRHVIPRPMER